MRHGSVWRREECSTERPGRFLYYSKHILSSPLCYSSTPGFPPILSLSCPDLLRFTFDTRITERSTICNITLTSIVGLRNNKPNIFSHKINVRLFLFTAKWHYCLAKMSEPEMKTAVVIQQQQTDKESKQIKMTH